MAEEIEKRAAFVDSRRENGKLGGRPKKPSGYPNAKPSAKPTKNLPEDENVNEDEIEDKVGGVGEGIEFEQVWKEYGRIGSKVKAREKWVMMKPELQQKIFAHVVKFVEAHTKAGKAEFIPHFTTYLNAKRWEDDSLPYQNLPKNQPQQTRTTSSSNYHLMKLVRGMENGQDNILDIAHGLEPD